MYVCLCNPTTDTMLKTYIKGNINITLEQLKKELNICQTCTCCSDLLEQIYFYEKSNYN